jgi:hypothetical protein
LPHGLASIAHDGKNVDDFLRDFLIPEFLGLQVGMRESFPCIFIILGNDDGRGPEEDLRAAEAGGLWQYVSNRKVAWGSRFVYGYAYVPPTPFQLKDWDRYDVSRYVDPGCISPEEGFCSVPVSDSEKRFATIQGDLQRLTGSDDLAHSILLFHTPPYQTALDRLAGEPRIVDHVPLDVHAGSIAVKRLIEDRQPCITLHGHIHESARITGAWQERIGRTYAFSAAHDGKELALIRFSPDEPGSATRELL